MKKDIAIIGIGNSGNEIVSKLQQSEKYDRILINESEKELLAFDNTELKFEIDTDALENSELSFKMAASAILLALKNYNSVIFVARLKADFETFVSPKLIKLCSQENIQSLFIYHLPFEFEGQRSIKAASVIKAELLEGNYNGVEITNESILATIPSKTTIRTLYDATENIFILYIYEIIAAM